MEKTIEIPFGAKDSELKGWEYTIPENMEAEIKDGKIIVKQKESEDEKIRKQLIGFFSGRYALCNINTKDAIAYLERQKEQKPASGNSEKPNNHAEWSEEDGNKLYQVMEVLLADKTIALRENPHCKALHRAYDELLDWLKSLRPKPHWKPSEEQMEVDLEKFADKIKTFQGRYKYPEIVSIKGAMAFMARMFYQYPNVARQWYDSLPKATMD